MIGLIFEGSINPGMPRLHQVLPPFLTTMEEAKVGALIFVPPHVDKLSNEFK